MPADPWTMSNMLIRRIDCIPLATPLQQRYPSRELSKVSEWTLSLNLWALGVHNWLEVDYGDGGWIRLCKAESKYYSISIWSSNAVAALPCHLGPCWAILFSTPGRKSYQYGTATGPPWCGKPPLQQVSNAVWMSFWHHDVMKCWPIFSLRAYPLALIRSLVWSLLHASIIDKSKILWKSRSKINITRSVIVLVLETCRKYELILITCNPILTSIVYKVLQWVLATTLLQVAGYRNGHGRSNDDREICGFTVRNRYCCQRRRRVPKGER